MGGAEGAAEGGAMEGGRRAARQAGGGEGGRAGGQRGRQAGAPRRHTHNYTHSTSVRARLEQRVVVGAAVNGDGHAGRGDDASHCCVEREAGDGHADGLRGKPREGGREGGWGRGAALGGWSTGTPTPATPHPRVRATSYSPPCAARARACLHSQVAQRAAALAVCQADGLNSALGPVFKDGGHRALVSE